MAQKTKQGALTAARKVLGAEAVEGVDFNLVATGTGWTHAVIPPANEGAKAKRAPKAAKPNMGLGMDDARGVAVFTGAKKAARKPKAAKAPKAEKPQAPEGESKTDMLIGMMKRAGGANSKEMEEATGWAPHSVRGLIGTLKKRGVSIESKKLKGEPTIYHIVGAPASVSEAVGDVI